MRRAARTAPLLVVRAMCIRCVALACLRAGRYGLGAARISVSRNDRPGIEDCARMSGVVGH